MKTYVKPVAEIREFEVSNKIASLSSWLENEAANYGVSDVTEAAITSYYMTSSTTYLG